MAAAPPAAASGVPRASERSCSAMRACAGVSLSLPGYCARVATDAAAAGAGDALTTNVTELYAPCMRCHGYGNVYGQAPCREVA